MPDEQKRLIVERDMIESFIPVLNAEVDSEGYIRDKDSWELFESENGVALTVDAISYIKYTEEQRIVPVIDTFPGMVASLSERDFRKKAEC